MADRVFISHASQDRDVAGAVCEALEGRGIRCWIAPRDITPGTEYAEALYDAIGECTALVLIFSAHANQSPQVRREVERACRDGDPIIPFRIDDTIPAPGLLFNVGAVEWLAPASVELASHIGILAEIVDVRLNRPGEVLTMPAASERTWLGSPSVFRRLLATWMTVFLAIELVCALLDMLASVDAYANAVWSASILHEADPAERITGILGILLILILPTVLVWLMWLCGAYLTVEAAGVESLPFGAGSVAGRFMWPGLRFEGGASVVAQLWQASMRVTPANDQQALAARAPRWFWLFWWLAAALPPLTIGAVVVADADEWERPSLLVLAMITDLVWIGAGLLCLRVLKPIEHRLRAREATLAPASPEAPRSTVAGGT